MKILAAKGIFFINRRARCFNDEGDEESGERCWLWRIAEMASCYSVVSKALTSAGNWWYATFIFCRGEPRIEDITENKPRLLGDDALLPELHNDLPCREMATGVTAWPPKWKRYHLMWRARHEIARIRSHARSKVRRTRRRKEAAIGIWATATAAMSCRARSPNYHEPAITVTVLSSISLMQT